MYTSTSLMGSVAWFVELCVALGGGLRWGAPLPLGAYHYFLSVSFALWGACGGGHFALGEGRAIDLCTVTATFYLGIAIGACANGSASVSHRQKSIPHVLCV